MAKQKVSDTLREFEATHGDDGKDAVKAVRMYARVTCASADETARYCRSVAEKLGQLASWLEGNRW